MTGHQGLDALIGFAVAILLAWLLAIAGLAVARPKGKGLELEAAYRRFSGSAKSARNRRPRLKLLLLAVLVILNVVWLGLLLSGALGERAVESSSAQSAAPGRLSSSAVPPPASEPRSGSAERKTIQLHDPPESAKPFQTVRIQGAYSGGADTFVRVQRWEAGKWLDFPVPTKTDQSGKFTAYIELDQPGRYQLRVLDPGSDVTSTPFVLVIKG